MYKKEAVVKSSVLHDDVLASATQGQFEDNKEDPGGEHSDHGL